MKIKVCGMKHTENIKELIELNPDFIGFIFYEKSPRYVSDLDIESIKNISIKKVGVFVNETINNILAAAEKYQLNAIQLHGNERPETCKAIKEKGLMCIKAFNIENANDFACMTQYEDVCDYFLFDTKTSAFGGSGQKFDWQILQQYKLNTPFFLSGGIRVEDIGNIKLINHSQFTGVDINSRFEITPGLKNIEKIKEFIEKVKTHTKDPDKAENHS